MKELKLFINHLQKSYARPILRDINISADNNSYIAIVGKSGSGKSTLMNIIGLIEEFDKGEICFNNTVIRKNKDYSKIRLEAVGFVFQSYNLIPTLSCKENILLPTLYEKRQKVYPFDELVSMLEIEHLLSQRVNLLSGGEKQRVAIARALILNPCLLLADEPTGNLDAQNKNIIMNLFQREHEKGRGVILITHDDEVAGKAKEIYELKEGFLYEREKNKHVDACGPDDVPQYQKL